jgi:hypothetical protein
MSDTQPSLLPPTLGQLAHRYAFAVAGVEAAKRDVALLQQEIAVKCQAIARLNDRIEKGEEGVKEAFRLLSAELERLDAAEAAEAASSTAA